MGREGKKSLSKSEVKSTDLEASLGLREVYPMSLLSEQTTFRSCLANLYVFEVQAVSLNWSFIVSVWGLSVVKASLVS